MSTRVIRLSRNSWTNSPTNVVTTSVSTRLMAASSSTDTYGTITTVVLTASSTMIVVRLAKVVELVLDDLGMTVNQYRALTLIDAGAPPIREFAVRLAMQPPNLSTLIDGLVGRG